MTREPTRCDICGREHYGRAYTTCTPCRKAANSHPTPGDALPAGRWQPSNWGILRYVTDDPTIDLRRDHHHWDARKLRDAHAAWTRGVRDDWATEGERRYQREKKRQQRRAKKEAA